MGFNRYTEGDFDRLVFVPFCVGVLLFLYGGWSLYDEWRRLGEWESFWIKFTLAGVGLMVFGAVLILWLKPENADKF